MNKLIKFLNSPAAKKLYFGFAVIIFVLGFIGIKESALFLKYSYIGIFFFNVFGGTGTLLIPVLAFKLNIILLAISTAAGMAVNDTLGYLVGQSGTAVFNKTKWIKRAENIVIKYDVWGLFFLSAIPIPYDIIGIISGYFGIKYVRFIIPTFLGKVLRMALIGYAAVYFLRTFN